MEIIPTSIPDVKILKPKRFGDARGYFSETYRREEWAKAGIDLEFVQDNHSMSAERGVVRGLHYQVSPHAQTKVVRVTRGAVFDVAVDLRRSSPTFGKHVSLVLSAAEWNQILVPRGFAHGFCTLEANTEVIYKVDDYWFPECERGIFWNDQQLGIPWPLRTDQAILSEKDNKLPRFADVTSLFP